MRSTLILTLTLALLIPFIKSQGMHMDHGGNWWEEAKPIQLQTFDEIMSNCEDVSKDSHIFIEFFNPQCKYCKDFLGDFNKIYDFFSDKYEDEVKIFKVNGWDVPEAVSHFKVPYYPFFIYIAPNSNCRRQSYYNQSPRTFQNVKRWMLNNVKAKLAWKQSEEVEKPQPPVIIMTQPAEVEDLEQIMKLRQAQVQIQEEETVRNVEIKVAQPLSQPKQNDVIGQGISPQQLKEFNKVISTFSSQQDLLNQNIDQMTTQITEINNQPQPSSAKGPGSSKLIYFIFGFTIGALFSTVALMAFIKSIKQTAKNFSSNKQNPKEQHKHNSDKTEIVEPHSTHKLNGIVKKHAIDEEKSA